MGNRWKQSGQSKKEGKQDNTGNTKAEQTQEDKTTKIKQETTKSNPNHDSTPLQGYPQLA